MFRRRKRISEQMGRNRERGGGWNLGIKNCDQLSKPSFSHDFLVSLKSFKARALWEFAQQFKWDGELRVVISLYYDGSFNQWLSQLLSGDTLWFFRRLLRGSSREAH